MPGALASPGDAADGFAWPSTREGENKGVLPPFLLGPLSGTGGPTGDEEVVEERPPDDVRLEGIGFRGSGERRGGAGAQPLQEARSWHAWRNCSATPSTPC